MRRRAQRGDEPLLFSLYGLSAIVAVVLLGAIVGSVFSANISSVSEAYILSYIDTLADSSTWTIFGTMLWDDLVFLVLIFLSAFTRLGVLVVPVTLFCKGFLLSLLVTAFVKFFGFSGYFMALLTTFFDGLTGLLCLTALSAQSFSLAGKLYRKPPGGSKLASIRADRAYVLSGIVCLLIISAAALLQSFLAPLAAR